MLDIEIRRPRTEDINELHQFFRTVIEDTFNKEGIGDQLEDLEAEVESKKAYLAGDLTSNGEDRFFLLTLERGQIIGTIEHGAASDLICKCTDNALKELHEVGTVFVHPDYQGMGVGNLLLENMYQTLRNKGILEFCLDSGYARAQKIWKKKFGEPAYLLENYWGEGYHHMIWRVKFE
ncbi:GNAT family N-acetyltransferase [Sutcliffiella horikoshii]|uniref:GNAT family N-acetyltransferase n=1 Tax=Sutcliffiella horikoshii TaxID=79883 RepID=A0AA94WQ94_9BACI|nr:GNAT family N-acetyltransferase [Sutcliffiella horikoshii]TYS58426.1 GNAT family N-acetyltransferase [Sutcliffiella horikoshii]